MKTLETMAIYDSDGNLTNVDWYLRLRGMASDRAREYFFYSAVAFLLLFLCVVNIIKLTGKDAVGFWTFSVAAAFVSCLLGWFFTVWMKSLFWAMAITKFLKEKIKCSK